MREHTAECTNSASHNGMGRFRVTDMALTDFAVSLHCAVPHFMFVTIR